jgi:hypothetical protein
MIGYLENIIALFNKRFIWSILVDKYFSFYKNKDKDQNNFTKEVKSLLNTEVFINKKEY